MLPACHSPQTFLWSPRPPPQVKTEFFFLNSSCNLSLLARSVSYTQSTSNNLGEGEQSLFGNAPEPDSFVLHKNWRDTWGLKSHSTLLMQMWQPTTSYLEAVIHLHTWARTSAQMRSFRADEGVILLLALQQGRGGLKQEPWLFSQHGHRNKAGGQARMGNTATE